jgi:hypothetical protein
MFYKITLNEEMVLILLETVENKEDDSEYIKFLDFEEYSKKISIAKGVYRFVDGELIDDENYVENNTKDKKIYLVEKLKNNLKETDYKIIKCYEAFMRQQTLPYNLEELSAQRDAWRTEINQLEEELAELD